MIAVSSRDRKSLMAGGNVLGRILTELAQRTIPGVTTLELDQFAQRRIEELGAEPSFLGYQGYPNVLCTSVNAEVVHGLPKATVRLKEGDLVGLDLGVRFEGLFTDAAITVGVARISKVAQRLLEVTRVALIRGIEAARVGSRVGDIGATVQRYVEAEGFGVVRQLVGHGVGRAVHEDPPVPNFGEAGTGPLLVDGQVLAVEPMVTEGDPAVITAADGWTVVTKDRKLAAHFEHTILLESKGTRILTEVR